MVGAITYHLIG